MTTELENLREQERELKRKIEQASKETRINNILEHIRSIGFEEDRGTIMYENLLAESKQSSLFIYKGIHFETSLDFSDEEISRKVKIIKIEDFKLFDDIQRLMARPAIVDDLYYKFTPSFYELPRRVIYEDGHVREYYGEVRVYTIARKWRGDKKWRIYGREESTKTLENTCDQLAQQVDYFEKISQGLTDIRDKDLKYFEDTQLEYEMKQRGYIVSKTKPITTKL